MTSRLGRNPLGKSGVPKSAPKKASAIFASELELDGTEAKENQKSFTNTFTSESSKTFVQKFAFWLIVDLPADGYILGLKSVLLMKAVLES